MKRDQTELSYLRAAVQNASPVGLVIILFDQLINDLKGAIEAIEKRDVEQRSAQLKHGYLVLQQLQESLDMEKGGTAAQHFAAFYSAVRAKMLEAHIQVRPEILRRQIDLLIDVRQAWQQIENQGLLPPPANTAVTPNPPVRPGAIQEERTTDWTA